MKSLLNSTLFILLIVAYPLSSLSASEISNCTKGAELILQNGGTEISGLVFNNEGNIHEEFNKKQKGALELFSLGDYEEALLESYKALKYANLLDYSNYRAAAYSRMGINLMKLGDTISARTCHMESYQNWRAKNSEDPRILAQLAWEALNLGRTYEDSAFTQKYLSESAKIFKELWSNNPDKYSDGYLNVLSELSLLDLRMGQLDSAVRQMREYKRIFSQTKNVSIINEAFARYGFAKLYIQKGDLTEAKSELLKAKDILKDLKNYYLHPKIDSRLAYIFLEEGNYNKAFEVSTRGVNLSFANKNKGYRSVKVENGSDYDDDNIYGIHFLAALMPGTNIRKDSFVKLQESESRESLKKISFLMSRENKSAIFRRDREKLSKINDLSLECETIDIEIDKSLKERVTNRKIIVSKLKELENCRDRLSKIGTANLGQKVDQYINPKILSGQEMTRLLRKDEALLAFHFEKGYTFSWLITNETINFIKLETSFEQISYLTNNLKQNLIVENPRLLKPFDKNSASSLYRALIKPHEEYLLNKKSLILLQNKFLEGLPLSVLIQKGKNEGRWLFQDFNLSKVFSPSDLLKKKTIIERPLNSFYGFGDPPPHPYLQDLKHTRTELRNLAKAFVSEEDNLFFLERSTIDNLKKIEKDVKILAFSTHSIRPNEINGIEEHSLLLNKEWLSASKVAFDLKINAELVLLTACNTSWSSELYKKPLLDLPSAFQISGAESIVVSNWKITDESTKDIMTKASDYIYINKGKEDLISEALRKGMIDYIKNNEDSLIQTGARLKISKAHPYFWAPFEVLGNPRGKGI